MQGDNAGECKLPASRMNECPENWWTCYCGEVNSVNEDKCGVCGRVEGGSYCDECGEDMEHLDECPCEHEGGR